MNGLPECRCGHPHREHRYTMGTTLAPRRLVCLYDDGREVCSCNAYRPTQVATVKR